ncbi:hypothetical protein ACFOON_04360, partial [Novosphingobium piscinae]
MPSLALPQTVARTRHPAWRRGLTLPGVLLAGLLAGAALIGGFTAMAQQSAGLADPGETRRALAEARQQGAAAQRRAEQLEARARAAGAAAERSAA